MNVLEPDLILKLYAWFSGLCFEFESFCLYYLKANTEKSQILKLLLESSPSEELSNERRIMETILFEFNNAEKIKERILEKKQNIEHSFYDQRYLFDETNCSEGNDLPYIPLVIRTLTMKIEALEDLVKDFEDCFLKIRKLISDFRDQTSIIT
ncbi:hypothetical protein TNIN_339101 [Trichonephila inaurata madagascariensis]|uniref:Uncharacterized protein n=1 Tax=Trichonephila inaurata madagascariensis TaxID=2747483 RepID=A0A8X6YS65_9ARAC|nr:hypothetical protein TNIN_370531 [Trichonephila inaurata madagascariensis]GFY44738.1 hypothetical protein TNIN_41671 [Trichonephila inaurata madagascariensis]GFY74744.1 hypothetical protein TNIN_339101 [Trichonephila inaurata madagascariensis]